jgi:hypothetical protein
MSSISTRKGAFALTAMLSAFTVLACAEPAGRDPLTGHWRLQRNATHYGGTATPRADEAFDCVMKEARLTCMIESVREDGLEVKGTFTAAYDGRQYEVSGVPGVDRVSLQRVSATSADATFSSGARPVFGYRTFKSSDGRTLIVVTVDPVTRRILNSAVVYASD